MCVFLLPGGVRGVIGREQEVLLREGHLVALAAHGDQRETFLGRPRAHHLGHVLVLRGHLHLRAGRRDSLHNLVRFTLFAAT